MYCGTAKGAVVVFDLLKGTFIKQIPFQTKLFNGFFFNKERQSNEVTSI
jgi:hypothetical protein